MKSRKILYTASTFGHLAAFHQPYMRWFAAQGCEVHAAAGGAPQVLDGVSQYLELPFEKRMTARGNFRAVSLLADAMRRERYCLVSTHTALAAFFTRLAVRRAGKGDTVVLNTSHGYLFDDETKWLKHRMLLGAEQLTASVTDYLLTMNAYDDALARKHQLGRHIVSTAGMGVDFSRFSAHDQATREAARRTFGLPADALVLVCAAEFSARKNQQLLIDMLPQLPAHVHLLLAGRGKLLEPCRAHADKLGLGNRVHFCGFVQQIETCYHAADICVSASRIEGLPFNIMEAMHCALPVIASAVKGHVDLVQNGVSGFLYPFGDGAACAAAVRQLANPALRAQMGAAAKHAVAPYGLDAVYPQLIAVYHEALSAATHS